MSPRVSPSPRPLSASLLVIETTRTVGFGSQTSLTVIDAVICASLWSGGHSVVGATVTVSFGGVVSTIFTVCVAMPLFLDSSMAVHVTVVLPRVKEDGASFVSTGAASQTSLALAVPRTTDVPVGPVHSAVTAAGAVTVGGLVSMTSTVVASSSY